MSTIAEKIAELKDTISALEAFDRGDAVQWFSVSLNDWLNDIDPMFSLSQNRRIRIKPKPREWWDVLSKSGCHISRHHSRSSAQRDADEYNVGMSVGFEVVHVLEVIE